MRFRHLALQMVKYTFVAWFVISLNFVLPRLVPGDPLIHLLGEADYYYLLLAEPAALEALREKYGLGDPLVQQYGSYLASSLRGDFGYSYQFARPVLELVLFRLRWTLLLVVPAVALGALLGGYLGAKAGWDRESAVGRHLTAVFILINSIPPYGLALLLLSLLAFWLGVLPVGGMQTGGLTGWAYIWDIGLHLVLPLSILTLYKTAYHFLIMQSLLDCIRREEYVLTAAAKGLSQEKILWRHGLRNALLPYIATICMQFGYAVAGALMLEIVFSWDGMGTLVYQAVLSKDFPVLQLSFLVISFCVIAMNLLADFLYAVLDPRLRGAYVES